MNKKKIFMIAKILFNFYKLKYRLEIWENAFARSFLKSICLSEYRTRTHRQTDGQTEMTTSFFIIKRDIYICCL